MPTLHRPLQLAVLCLGITLTAGGEAGAQQTQPRSTANPYGGLRGNSERGQPTRGASSRGVSGRTTARPQPPLVPDKEAEASAKGAGPMTPAPMPAPAPKAAAPRAGAAKPKASPSQIRPRIVTLKSGKVLRGRSHLSHGAWKVRTKRGWQTVAADEVQRTDLESDVLTMVRKRRRSRDRSDPTERLAEAEWMLKLGLVSEALDELDNMLADELTAPGALDVLGCANLADLLPARTPSQGELDAMQQLLEFAPSSSSSVQELAIMELVSYGARHRNQLERALLSQKVDPQPARQQFAKLALRRLFPGTAH